MQIEIVGNKNDALNWREKKSKKIVIKRKQEEKEKEKEKEDMEKVTFTQKEL